MNNAEIFDLGLKLGFGIGIIGYLLFYFILDCFDRLLFVSCPQCRSINSKSRLQFRKYKCRYCGLKLMKY